MHHLNLQRLTPVVRLLAAGATTNTVNLLGANWALFSLEPFPKLASPPPVPPALHTRQNRRRNGWTDLVCQPGTCLKVACSFCHKPTIHKQGPADGSFLISSHLSHISILPRAHRKCLQREACANFEQQPKQQMFA